MRSVIIFFTLFLFYTSAPAQCSAGNCISGKGTYNYGWCVYTGEFKNGKPEGRGVMKYDDYSYSGSFANGLEDGDGIITNNDGKKENVHYTAGKKNGALAIKLAPGEYTPMNIQDKNCLEGNCINGFGTYQFPSGNKYTGNFLNYKREGSGTGFFANGDQFVGTWHNNEKQSGTYTFSTGASYTGSYDEHGMEYDGNIVSVAGMQIPYVKGKAIIPPPPAITYADDKNDQPATSGKPAPRERMKRTCPMCNGLGKTHETFYDAATHRDANGYTIFGQYSFCSMCNGTGQTN